MSAKRMLLTILAASALMLAVGIGPRWTGNARALPPAQVGATIPYSGRLSDETGQPVADGAYDFTFALYAAESGGELLWREEQAGVAVQGGAFTVLLGRVVPLPQEALEGGARWLEVGVRGPGEAEYTRLAPRQELSAAAPAGGVAPTGGGLSCWHTHWGEAWSGNGNGLVLYGHSNHYATLYAEDTSPNGGYGGYFKSNNGTGIYVEGARGMFLKSTGDGVTLDYPGLYGIYVWKAGSYGMWASTAQADNNYGLFTVDNLYSLNFHSLGATMHIVQNGGSQPLEPGDVVVFSGLAAPMGENGVPVIRVAKATSANSTGVAGVVFSRYHIEALSEGKDTTSSADREITPAGPVPPGEYLLVVVQGPAQVKVSPLAGPIRPGDLLASASEAGYAAKAAEASLGGVKMASPGTVLGKALEALDAGQSMGLLWIWVTLQ